MPSIFAIGNRVRLTNRHSTNEPMEGAIGVVSLVMEGPVQSCGVDFADCDPRLTRGANLHRLPNAIGVDTLPNATGRFFSDNQLELVDAVAAEDQGPGFVDLLVGSHLLFIPDAGWSERLSGRTGVVLGVDPNLGRVNSDFRIHIQVNGAYEHGGEAHGYLPPNSRNGHTTARPERLRFANSVQRLIEGQRVRMNTRYDRIPEGSEGTILRATGTSYLVEFDEDLNLHDGSGLGRPNRCWNISRDNPALTPVDMTVTEWIANRDNHARLRQNPLVTRGTPVPNHAVYRMREGDTVQCTNRVGGLAQGRCGVVIAVDPGETTGWVDFGNGYEGLRHPRINTSTAMAMRANQLTLVDKNALPVGTRVRRNGTMRANYGNASLNDEGLIRAALDGDGEYAVEFDRQRIGFHDCDGATVNHHGYWMPPDLIEVVQMPHNQDVPARARRVDEYTLDVGAIWQRAGRTARPRFGDHPMPAPNPEVGSHCTVVNLSGEMAVSGIAMGDVGIVVHTDTKYYYVDFHPKVLARGTSAGGRGHDGSCHACPRNYIRINAPADAKAVDFEKGDRVSVVHMAGGAAPPVGTEGTVHAVHGYDLAIDFYPYRWKYGQDIGTGNNRSGMTLPKHYVQKIVVPEAVPLKPYYLVSVIDGKTSPLEDQPTFDTGHEASTFAKELSATLGYKVQVRKNSPPDTKWREREIKRLEDGTYKPMPKAWDLPPIPDHFLHLSVKEPGQVAFTPSVEHGEQDRQVHSRPGAYVKKFYPELDQRQIGRYSALATCDGGLEIITDGEEMARVYRLGEQGAAPESCMKYDFVRSGHGGPRTPVHPIEVYAAGDIALSCLRQDGAIVARCLVWPERRLFTRPYGDIAKITAILEADGFTRANFIGAKLRRVTFKYDDQTYYVCPYVDESMSVQGAPGALGVVDDGKHLIITEANRGQSTNQAMGCIRIEKKYRMLDRDKMVRCERCNEMSDPDEMSRIIVGLDAGGRFITQRWCRTDTARSTYRCEGYRERMSRDIPARLDHARDRHVSQIYVDANNGYLCDYSGYAFFDTPRVLEDGRKVAPVFFDDACFTCAGTGKTYMNIDNRTHDVQFEEIGGKRYHVSYVAEHPELKKSVATVADAEREAKISMRRAKKKSAIEGSIDAAIKQKVARMRADEEQAMADLIRDLEGNIDAGNPF